jgi:putative sterol carrier protein
MTAKEFFENKFAPKLATNPNLLSSSGVKAKKVALQIEGDGGGQWLFLFDSSGNLEMKMGKAETSDCLIEMKDSVFQGLLEGKVNITMAVMTRKIRVKGELSLAALVGSALKKSLA